VFFSVLLYRCKDVLGGCQGIAMLLPRSLEWFLVHCYKLLGCSARLPGSCYAVAKVVKVFLLCCYEVARVFCVVYRVLLGCSGWLPGHCYAVAKVF